VTKMAIAFVVLIVIIFLIFGIEMWWDKRMERRK